MVSSYDSHTAGGRPTGFNSEMCSTSSGLTKPAYSFGVGKLVPALARVNESMPQIEPCHGATMCVVKIDVTLINCLVCISYIGIQ